MTVMLFHFPARKRSPRPVPSTAILAVTAHQQAHSHRPDEYTPIEPIMAAVQVLSGALERLAYDEC